MSRGCPDGVQMVSRGCPQGVHRVSRGCPQGVQRVSWGCHEGRVSNECPMGFQSVLVAVLVSTSRCHPLYFFHWKEVYWCCCCFSTITVPSCECPWIPGIIYLHKNTLGLNHCDFCSCWCMHYYTSPILPLEILWTPLDALWTSSGYPLEILWTSSRKIFIFLLSLSLHPLDVILTTFLYLSDILCIFFIKKVTLLLFFHRHRSFRHQIWCRSLRRILHQNLFF